MRIIDFIKYLTAFRPDESEIIASLDEFDEELILSITDMFDYRVNESIIQYESTLLDCIYNTTVYEKGLANFYFVSTLDDRNFAYTDDDRHFFLEDSKIYLKYENEYLLICTSEEDFLYGMIFSFKANMDFSYRRAKSNINDAINALVEKVPNSNSDYFVQRMREQYSG